MKDVHDWMQVKRLHKRGIKILQISKQLNISRNTVKRLLKLSEEPRYTRTEYTTKIDQYKSLIQEWYLNPEYDFIGTRIKRELNKLGYTGIINPIYRYLIQLREEKTLISSKATTRVETPPGDQAQFDWAEYDLVINNTITKVYCFSLVLAFSRNKDILFSLKSDSDAIYEAIQDLFDGFGGITQEILIDNPKALVIENIQDKEPKYNLDALRMATHMNIELNACAPYRARTKGKVEKPFQYIEEQFIKGNTFVSMAELNAAGKEFMKDWCLEIHGTTKRIPLEAFKEEQQYLLPLPKKHFMKTIAEDRKVSLDSLISVDSNKYSVPAKFVDKTVKYRIFYGYKLVIYDSKGNIIKEHELCYNRQETTRDPLDYTSIAIKTPKSIPEIKRKFTSTFSRGTEYLELAGRALQQPSYHARQLLKLQEIYTVESLDLILEYCINHNIYAIDDIKVILKEKSLEILVGSLGDNAIDATEANPDMIRDFSYYAGGGQF